MARFALDEETRDGVRVVTLRGELDLDTSAQIAAPLADAAQDPDRPLVIDLTECEFIDSTGLAALLHGTKPMQDGGSNVALACPDNLVRQLLNLSAIDQTLPVFDSREKAIAAVRAPS